MADRTNCTALAVEYAHDVVKGRTPACKYVRDAAQRFLDDLERDDLVYDVDAVERCCFFLESLPQVTGRWRGKLLVLSEWQCFVVANLIGLKWKFTTDDHDAGTRKYAECYIEIPRKNGKSFFAAAMCLYFLTMDDEPGAEVYCAATSEDQAKLVFGVVRQMLNDNDDLRTFLELTVQSKSIFNDGENLRFKPVIGDPPDGTNPSFAVVDEYHEHTHDRALKTFQSGMPSREQPLLFVITTAGHNVEGPCHRYRDECIQVLDGTLKDAHADSVFALIYTVDTDGDEHFWKTEAALRMANPSIGGAVSMAYLKRQQAQAIRSRHAQSEFKTKHLNIWIGQSDPWIDMNLWHQNVYAMAEDEDGKPLDPPFRDMLDLPCLVITDLSAKHDFTAAVVLFYEEEDVGEDGKPKPEERVYWAYPFFWLPRATFEKVPRYAPWKEHIILHEGDEIDVLALAKTIIAWQKKHSLKIREYVTDPHRSVGVEQHIADKLVWVEPVRFNQSIGSYSAAMYELQSAVQSGRFRHPGNPVLDWMVGNMPYRRDNDNNVKPVRNKDDAKKIDGAVCCVMGAGRAMVQPKESRFKLRTIDL